MQNYFQEISEPFTKSLVDIGVLLSKVYNVSVTDSSGDKSNITDATVEYCPHHSFEFFNVNKFKSEDTVEADGKPSFSSSNLQQSISYYESRYKDSSNSFHPSVSNSHHLISEAVNLADIHLENYDKALVDLTTVISELEAESLRLGQQLNDSAVINDRRKQLISTLIGENNQQNTILENWRQLIKETENAIRNKENTEYKQTMGMLAPFASNMILLIAIRILILAN